MVAHRVIHFDDLFAYACQIDIAEHHTMIVYHVDLQCSCKLMRDTDHLVEMQYRIFHSWYIK